MCVAFDAMAFQQHDPIPASAASGRPSERVPLFAEIARDFRKTHRVQDPVRWHTPLRVIPTPQCMWSSSGIECASGLSMQLN